MRGRGSAGAIGLGCAGLVVLTALTAVGPAAATERTTTPRGGCAPASGCEMPGGGLAADCREAGMNTPPGDPRDVALTADVADGATVAPGEDIMIRLSWDPEAWSGPDLDRALACVHVKGVLDPELSAGERPTANDGVFEYRLHVPEDIKPDCDICVLGFLAGEAAGGGPRMARSDRWCVMSGPPAPPPPAPPVTQPPAPPATEPPAPATTTTTVAAAPSPDVPAQVAGVTETRPEPAALAEPAPAGELPRTGGFAQLVTGAGGLSLTLGGLGVIGGAGRRPRRRTTVSSEM